MVCGVVFWLSLVVVVVIVVIPDLALVPSVSMVSWSLVGFEEILRFTQDDS